MKRPLKITRCNCEERGLLPGEKSTYRCRSYFVEGLDFGDCGRMPLEQARQISMLPELIALAKSVIESRMSVPNALRRQAKAVLELTQEGE